MAKKKLPEDIAEFFRRKGSKGGKIGGKRSLETMTAEERSARAKHAVDAREKKRAAAKKKPSAKKPSKKPAKPKDNAS